MREASAPNALALLYVWQNTLRQDLQPRGNAAMAAGQARSDNVSIRSHIHSTPWSFGQADCTLCPPFLSARWPLAFTLCCPIGVPNPVGGDSSLRPARKPTMVGICRFP